MSKPTTYRTMQFVVGKCEICGEICTDDQELGEMHEPMLEDPEMFSEARAGIVHAQCGLDAGWQVS